MKKPFTFEHVVEVNNIRKLFVNIIFDLMKFRKIECYIFGGFVRDTITIEQAQKKSNSCEKLKQFMCNKFDNTLKFDIDLAISTTYEKFNTIANYLQELITSHLKFHYTIQKENVPEINVKYNFLKHNNRKKSYLKNVLFKFMCKDILFGIDFINYKNKLGKGDFRVNTMTYDSKWNLGLMLRSFNNIDINKQKILLADIMLDIVDGKAIPCHDFLKIMNRIYVRKNANGVYEIINQKHLKKYIKAYKRIIKMISYGYTISNILNLPQTIKTNATCCDTPQIINFPKQFKINRHVACCVNCKTLSNIVKCME